NYRAHRLPPEETAAVEEHLRECAACRRELAVREQLSALLRAWPDIAPRPDFEAAVWDQIQAHRKEAPASQWRWVPVGAAALVALMVVWVGWWTVRGTIPRERGAGQNFAPVLAEVVPVSSVSAAEAPEPDAYTFTYAAEVKLDPTTGAVTAKEQRVVRRGPTVIWAQTRVVTQSDAGVGTEEWYWPLSSWAKEENDEAS
ncbi:MAG TPA: hypothetical protein EYP85_04995, partial [Armatimonadetes bacterium]|nr:hypothetical protein [Armatimonadota bacterium]